MRKPVLSSVLNYEKKSGISYFLKTCIICTVLINDVKSATTPQGGLGSDKHVVIAVPNRNAEDSASGGGSGHLPSFSRTMAVLGSRIKKKINDAHKTLFLPDSVKRVGLGQVGRKPPQHNQRALENFRPHQPDITSEVRSGKLTLPVEIAEEGGVSEIARTRSSPKPTPMANAINPYTNGVAASFPPGIDPYEGFIKYAAENLDTPMGNMIDYHSLEHYYGPQHPLNPYKNQEELKSSTPRGIPTQNSNPYADSFPYQGNNEVETSNSPPPPPPPPPPHHGGHGPGPGPGPGHGFRSHHPGGPPGHSNHYPMNSQEQEHGVDMFHAPSPGEPKPRPGPEHHPHEPDDEDYGPRPGPGRRPPPPRPSSAFPRKPPPMINHPYNEAPGGEMQDNSPPPPDLSVFEEGPPPELLSMTDGSGPGPIASPPFDPEGSNSPHPMPNNIENDQSQQLDGGDDAIWGILDLAQMLEKGQIPGAGGDKDKTSNAASSNQNPSKPGRVVMPIFNRAPPPRFPTPDASSEGLGGPFSASPNKFDYDDNDNDEDGPEEGKRPGQFGDGPFGGGSQESHTDYADDSY